MPLDVRQLTSRFPAQPRSGGQNVIRGANGDGFSGRKRDAFLADDTDAPGFGVADAGHEQIDFGTGRKPGAVAATDAGGQARILLPPDVIYPVDARITVSDARATVLESRIPSSGVAGLYPGDVWMVRFPERQ